MRLGPFKYKGSLLPGIHQAKQDAQLALISIGGILYFVGAVAILHILRPELNPVTHAVSNYAIGPFGWLMTAAFFILALSEFALTLGLARSLTASKSAAIGVLLLNLAAAGMVVTGIFPGDVKSPHPPGTLPSLIHWIGAGISFLSLLIATFLFAHCFKTETRWQSFQCSACVVSVMIVVALVAFGILTLIGWVGVGERVYIAANVLWLLLASVRLRAIATSKTGIAPFSEKKYQTREGI
jgi:hypothetical protein